MKSFIRSLIRMCSSEWAWNRTYRILNPYCEYESHPVLSWLCSHGSQLRSEPSPLVKGGKWVAGGNIDSSLSKYSQEYRYTAMMSIFKLYSKCIPVSTLLCLCLTSYRKSNGVQVNKTGSSPHYPHVYGLPPAVVSSQAQASSSWSNLTTSPRHNPNKFSIGRSNPRALQFFTDTERKPRIVRIMLMRSQPVFIDKIEMEEKRGFLIVGKNHRHDGSRAGILSPFGYVFLLSFISLGNRSKKLRKKRSRVICSKRMI